MANGNQSGDQANSGQVMVRATVIMRIPDLDAVELVSLYQKVNEIIQSFGGEYNVDTMPQNQGLPQSPG